MWLRTLGRALLDLAYPTRCGGCDRLSDSGFCPACVERLQPVRRLGCARCGEPARAGARSSSACPRCRAGRPFDLARAPYVYADPLRQALTALKFRLREEVALALADLLVEAAVGPRDGEGPFPLDDIPFAEATIVCPVPLHSSRERYRGFNQSHYLAHALAEALGAAYDPRFLVRTRETRPQFGLMPREREANVEAAFGRLPYIAEAVGAQVLLVDDIITTGATVAACAQALRSAGATRVWVVALARAAPEDVPRA